MGPVKFRWDWLPEKSTVRGVLQPELLLCLSPVQSGQNLNLLFPCLPSLTHPSNSGSLCSPGAHDGVPPLRSPGEGGFLWCWTAKIAICQPLIPWPFCLGPSEKLETGVGGSCRASVKALVSMSHTRTQPR